MFFYTSYTMLIFMRDLMVNFKRWKRSYSFLSKCLSIAVFCPLFRKHGFISPVWLNFKYAFSSKSSLKNHSAQAFLEEEAWCLPTYDRCSVHSLKFHDNSFSVHSSILNDNESHKSTSCITRHWENLPRVINSAGLEWFSRLWQLWQQPSCCAIMAAERWVTLRFDVSTTQ